MSARVVVGYNATVSSTAAVFWAAQEAVARGARLHIVSSTNGPSRGESDSMGSDVDTLAEGDVASVDEIRELVCGAYPRLLLATEILAGSSRDALVENLAKQDLLVVGSTRREASGGFRIGNTARWLTRHSPCPVVVVRHHQPIEPLCRILVGVDGSPSSAVTVRWAVDEADFHRAELVVVHGWGFPYRGVDVASQQARDLRQVDAACVLERAVESAREHCGSAVTGLLVEESPVSALLESSRAGDLLIVGSRGHGAIASAVFGSTVNGLLDLSPLPVAVVRDRHEACPDSNPDRSVRALGPNYGT